MQRTEEDESIYTSQMGMGAVSQVWEEMRRGCAILLLVSAGLSCGTGERRYSVREPAEVLQQFSVGKSEEVASWRESSRSEFRPMALPMEWYRRALEAGEESALSWVRMAVHGKPHRPVVFPKASAEQEHPLHPRQVLHHENNVLQFNPNPFQAHYLPEDYKQVAKHLEQYLTSLHNDIKRQRELFPESISQKLAEHYNSHHHHPFGIQDVRPSFPGGQTYLSESSHEVRPGMEKHLVWNHKLGKLEEIHKPVKTEEKKHSPKNELTWWDKLLISKHQKAVVVPGQPVQGYRGPYSSDYYQSAFKSYPFPLYDSPASEGPKHTPHLPELRFHTYKGNSLPRKVAPRLEYEELEDHRPPMNRQRGEWLADAFHDLDI